MLASLGHALRRLALVGGAVTCGLVALGVAWALWRGDPVPHSVAIFLYLGALVVAVGATSGGGGGRGGRIGSQRELLANQRRTNAELADSAWFFVLALLLGTGGALVDYWL
jgi:hypothetical protein